MYFSSSLSYAMNKMQNECAKLTHFNSDLVFLYLNDFGNAFNSLHKHILWIIVQLQLSLQALES